MRRSRDQWRWDTLDRDLNRIAQLEFAAGHASRPLIAPGIALVFVVLAAANAAVFLGGAPGSAAVIAAAVFGAYLAMTIGANDVANNMGPAVGAKALSLGLAITIAAVAESAGALLAGGDVVNTISTGILDPAALNDTDSLIRVMLAALISAALWVNLATWIGAPVSTTHSVVGAVAGAGLAAAGAGAVEWQAIAMITAGWVISPLLGGAIAAAVLALIKSRIIYRRDKIAAAKLWVPILIGVMAGVFAAYLAIKGLARIVTISPGLSVLVGGVCGLAAWAAAVPHIRRAAASMENRNRSLKSLFNLPLIVSGALLSFAHGANDVANAVGPLAAILAAVRGGGVADAVAVPYWAMLIGAFGISFGLFLFGPRLIRVVGSQITKLNPMRAYCVALSAAITVILASWLGLPVSSTHIAVGGVFGVGFFREWYMDNRERAVRSGRARPVAREERRRRKLVRRSHFMTIAAAWVVTVPAAATVSAAIYWTLTRLAG